MGASPGAAVALTKMNAEIDVRNVLPSIRVPSLVIHRSGDTCLKVEEGRFVASQIPGCKYVELGGIDHLPFVGDQAEVLDEIEDFLTGMRHAEAYDRVLATVLSVKIGRGNGEGRETRRLYSPPAGAIQRPRDRIGRGRRAGDLRRPGPGDPLRVGLNDSAKRLDVEGYDRAAHRRMRRPGWELQRFCGRAGAENSRGSRAGRNTRLADGEGPGGGVWAGVRRVRC